MNWPKFKSVCNIILLNLFKFTNVREIYLLGDILTSGKKLYFASLWSFSSLAVVLPRSVSILPFQFTLLFERYVKFSASSYTLKVFQTLDCYFYRGQPVIPVSLNDQNLFSLTEHLVDSDFAVARRVVLWHAFPREPLNLRFALVA